MVLTYLHFRILKFPIDNLPFLHDFWISQMLHVWNIYLDLPIKWHSFVGKYSSTMEHFMAFSHHMMSHAHDFFGWLSWFRLFRQPFHRYQEHRRAVAVLLHEFVDEVSVHGRLCFHGKVTMKMDDLGYPP